MAEVKPEADLPDIRGVRRFWPATWRWRISLVLFALIILASIIAWLGREQIAANLIETTLDDYGLEASYEIEFIAARRQVIRNLVVGDPAFPDFTAERVTVDISYTYGPPSLGRIEIIEPRLYGKFTDGSLSFGSLDRLLFAQTDEPAGLPSYNVRIVDGRARIASDYGVIGAKLDGSGQLDDGFVGKLAATAPSVGVEGCAAATASAYGDLTSAGGQLTFDGPLRLRDLACEGAQMTQADVGAVATLSEDFSSLEGELALDAAGLNFAGAGLARLGGEADFAMALGESNEFSLRHDITGDRLVVEGAKVARVGAQGTLRSQQSFARSEWTGRVTGDAVDLSEMVKDAGLADARKAGEGTLVGALLAKFERGLTRGLSAGTFAADASVRTTSETLRVVVPEAWLRSAEGETVLAMSRISYASLGANAGGDEPDSLTGNVLTGGTNLPQINARISRDAAGILSVRASMAEYSEGGNAMSIPRFEARRDAAGNVRLDGMVLGKGAVPGGTLQGLVVPIEGRWTSRTGLALGSSCSRVQLAGLDAYDFVLRRQNVTVCPEPGRSIVSYRDQLRVSAQLGELSVAGTMGDNPATISASSARLRYPGGFELAGLKANIGAPGSAVRFDASSINGSFGEAISGRFENADAALDLVPLDISELSGQWSFADNALTVSEGSFAVTDRAPTEGLEKRFEPLQGKDAVLTFADGKLRAEAGLFNPWSGRLVTDVTIQHDMASSEGRADIDVPGIHFEEGFQPEELTPLTKGLIAFADGEIAGTGLVQWNGEDVTSSGRFFTEIFDFAAAFGPVRGVQGSIEFTDLLNFTTAPDQVVTIASVNPGVEVLDGRVVYSITNGTLITVEDGRWPFMGGELILRPVELDYGGGKGQNYIFEMVGLDAATFVAQMELANIGATGRFDGTIPIIFDAQGNGTIQGGLMISRPPGGNVSYVGELTYKDLGAVGNFAFQTLRSLDYNQMSIELNGNLAGEIITNFNIDGVRQGAGASRNFVTRELAKLPIRFKVNVRSENFYTLATIVRGIFDPTVFASAAEVERFVGENIGALQSRQSGEDNPPPPTPPEPVTTSDELQRRSEPPVQPPESEDLP